MQVNRELLALLDYEARRNPILSAVIAKLDSLSVEDIKATKVKLPWIRKALLMLKQESDHESVAKRAASLLDGHVQTTYRPEVDGDLRRWTAIASFVRLGVSEIEVKHGDLLWLPVTGGVWLDSLFSPTIDLRILAHSVWQERCSRPAYLAAVQRRLGGVPVPSTVVEGAAAEGQFAITRPPKDRYSW